jgi:hypothetical protein
MLRVHSRRRSRQAVCKTPEQMNARRVEEMKSKISNLESNQFSPKGKELKMSSNQKSTRTQITDLPEIAVQMQEEELRIVSGGLISRNFSCYSPIKSTLAGVTNVATGQDWDTDKDPIGSLG